MKFKKKKKRKWSSKKEPLTCERGCPGAGWAVNGASGPFNADTLGEGLGSFHS